MIVVAIDDKIKFIGTSRIDGRKIFTFPPDKFDYFMEMVGGKIYAVNSLENHLPRFVGTKQQFSGNLMYLGKPILVSTDSDTEIITLKEARKRKLEKLSCGYKISKTL